MGSSTPSSEGALPRPPADSPAAAGPRNGRCAVLETAGLSRTFGGLRAVDGVSFAVREGEIMGLIGPNGAGKTTLFNLITGFLQPTAGRVRFRGEDITRWSPDRVTARGMARTFQNIRLFRGMAALDNVVVGGHVQTGATLFDAVLGTPRHRREEREIRARAVELLALVGLADRAAVPARSLAYGDQRRVEIARALATGPRLLLLDEPAAGMNTAETQALMGLIRRLRDDHGLTVLLIEHEIARAGNCYCFPLSDARVPATVRAQEVREAFREHARCPVTAGCSKKEEARRCAAELPRYAEKVADRRTGSAHHPSRTRLA